ncbi:Zn-dependent exopeptidase M28 [Actinoplanes bogorensis]|uniref:Zn-dependent exopeptidase M28 n=1 Tax=Paractinoplanes bogorensis TaxID=1610840 RepID=A0ABS5YS49_9ACTN|nr:M28 family metallopeptidase [Actinoplanes bogorensis]MBU2666267.1 Zn-dependent exopeptidase M28 [Actinoplanes bogorensis]
MDATDPAGGCRGHRPGRPAPALLPRPASTARRGASTVADLVSADTYRAVLEELTAHPTRQSFSEHYRATAGQATDRLAALAYATRAEPVTVGAHETLNVIADRPGTAEEAERRLVYVTAHLDSINQTGGLDAPGADDNASGAAGVLELARVLTTVDNRHDLRFILFGGEEQGLYGSRAHVAGLSAADSSRIAAVINMDMIGRRNAGTPSVLLEGAPVSQPLIDDLARAAHDTGELEVFVSLDPYASDHVPFIDAGLPAVLTIEGHDELNNDEHTPRDILEALDLTLAVAILRMNATAIADIATRA